MGKLLRVKPFVLLIVAWLAGLVRLHAWAQEEPDHGHTPQGVIALSQHSEGREPTARSADQQERD